MNAELQTAEAQSAVKLPPMQESLLPGTQAIMKATVAICQYRRGWLVRYKGLDGMVRQRQMEDSAAANAQFAVYLASLEREVRAAGWDGRR